MSFTICIEHEVYDFIYNTTQQLNSKFCEQSIDFAQKRVGRSNAIFTMYEMQWEIG